jgi:benzoyl-CoA 2,3-dioxygenase component B
LSFATGLKGRPDEAQYEDHRCSDSVFALAKPAAGSIASEDVPMRNAMNEVLRMSYVRDCELGLKRWNRQLARAGLSFQLRLPSPRFHRAIGVWSSVCCDVDGNVVDAAEFERRRDEWLPSATDRDFVRSLMQRVIAPGKMAGWIAPPERGINSLAIDYDYVRLS